MNGVLGALRRFELAQSAAFHRASEHLGVSDTVLDTLRTLLADEPESGMPMKDLARDVGISAAVLTGVIDKLEEKGWARRESSATDRRSTVVVSTVDDDMEVCHVLRALDEPLRDIANALADADAVCVRTLAREMEAVSRTFDPAVAVARA